MAGNDQASTQPERSSSKSVRLHYLDWLRVLATLGVLLYDKAFLIFLIG
jgi:hypothetical protein